MLYNIYSEYVMRLVLRNWNRGLSVGGVKVSNLRFADDTVLITGSVRATEALMGRTARYGQEYGLKINYRKYKVMIYDYGNSIIDKPATVANCQVVQSFIYLGALLHQNGSSEPEIRRRIQLGRAAMTHLNKIWQDNNITNATKVKLVQTLVFSVFSYASETWVIKQADRSRIDAFEMWCWRRMLRIPWTAKRTNASIINKLQPGQRWSSQVYKKILKYYGHVMRNSNIEGLIIQGKTKGKRRKGRSPTRWPDVVRNLMRINIENANRLSQDRNKWRTSIRCVIDRLED